MVARIYDPPDPENMLLSAHEETELLHMMKRLGYSHHIAKARLENDLKKYVEQQKQPITKYLKQKKKIRWKYIQQKNKQREMVNKIRKWMYLLSTPLLNKAYQVT